MEPHSTVTHTATSDQLQCGCVITYSVADGRNVSTITRCKFDCAAISIQVKS